MGNSSQQKRTLTDAQEATIQEQIESDPDTSEATDELLQQAKPFAEVFPDFADAIRRGRGRPAIDNPRRQISLRLDGDVIEKFKSTGKGWQGRVNEALRRAVGI